MAQQRLNDSFIRFSEVITIPRNRGTTEVQRITAFIGDHFHRIRVEHFRFIFNFHRQRCHRRAACR
ncbi:Uncharacterised protein [Vibrio cholerae]|nr:Uncharacterised protein [Vibrio cholerae]